MKRFLLGLAAAAALAGPAAAAPPDLSKMGAAELSAFLHAFPKGGELHNHLGGGTPAETLIDWAVEDGLCVDMTELAIRFACSGEGVKPASQVVADEASRSALIDSLTVRHPGFRDRSGHDQFFSAFGRRGTSPKRGGDALADTMDTLARQNTFYAELMVTPQAVASRSLGARAGWKGDPAATRDALSAAGLEKLVPAVVADTDAMEARAREMMQCGTPQAHPGCQVTVRYLFQAIRQGPPEQTMAQLQLGVATVLADRRWVGLQLVAPEDGYDATRYYGLHMRIVDLLTDHGRKVPVALHAGEVTLKLVTPESASHRVADAVRIAGARRIGHGTDIAGETGADSLAAEMAEKGILVEVNLLSNQSILEIDPKDHPYAWLRKKGVPVSLSTDDAGITRSDLSGDYAAAVRNGATYDDLRTSARNAIAFSFLSGEGLWADPNVYRKPTKACAGQIGRDEPKGACADLIAASDKAREQWRYERLLKAFEAAH
ncbi:MAG: adenosine deaminase [Phenylobacterium sp.]|uniref:adenosine deaminase family protein n=1 Tax=Phenylobacterium sp. TaxID=1871053 RepID=UPI0025EC7745|nr:adenosine deaminase [Phenylobacterium sp.]MBI1198015.1 adenosine deaminase [Phenylobacterium sp.]